MSSKSGTGLQVTLLVATSVAEEGLDIRQCNVVIRFDLAKTVLAYVQSRGRARKPGSDYILMVERYPQHPPTHTHIYLGLARSYSIGL